MKATLLGLLSVSLVSGHAHAASSASFNVGQAIPDNDANGLVSSGTVAGSGIASLGDVNVWFEILGGYTGDFQVTLSHGSAYAVLLNRVGRTASESYGYTDEGFSTTFLLSDQAANGDVHIYRQTLFGNPATPLGGDLDGAWAPDGRTTDPGLVLDTDSRDALLAAFNGADADGEWILHLVDLAPGGEGTLVRWGLDFTLPGETESEVGLGGEVPEPASWALGSLLTLAAARLILRRGASRNPQPSAS